MDARREARARESSEPQAPIVYVRGDGVNVVDADENRYVDIAAGFGALLLGHRPDCVARAVDRQRERLWLALGDVYASDAKLAICERLAKLHPGGDGRVMLGSSGADAVTAALKTAVLATRRAGVIAFEGSYHGLAHGPLAACGLRPAFREPFAAQLNPWVTFAPYPGDEASLAETMRQVKKAFSRGNVGAVIVEPILGRGGCVVPPPGFLPGLRAECDAAGALLVCDEIWTGLGRSGSWLASAEDGVVADVICLGKGLGGGFPISACIGTERAMAAWGSHGGATVHTGTHFGAPWVCAAASAVLDAIADRSLVERSRAAGARFRRAIEEHTLGRGVTCVTGRGLMIGVALTGGAPRALIVMRRLLEAGWIVLTGGAAGDVLTLTPPLDISEELLAAFAVTLGAVLAATP
ncbi:MAG: aspartate aminotransferase family protein [Myxococcota bacterium]|nr:aspartate aminotransferase family protein [Myxococcota bacterium]